jgi:GT2 family glycosyltransferase
MIDIIIPNYNGAALLPTCLDSLRAQTRRDFCVVVVDDGSTDDSVALVRRRYPEVQVIALPRNRGLAAAVNAGIEATGGEYVVLLNNDTEAHPRWLEHLIGALDRYPAYAFAASKLMLFDRRDHFHSAGDYYRLDGVPGSRGVWQRDIGQFDVMEEVFGPCAGAAAYRRAALEELAEQGRVFDEDLVMYCEDVDLNVRARLRGMRTVYVPRAVVYHRLSATGGGALASYYCGRNLCLYGQRTCQRRKRGATGPFCSGHRSVLRFIRSGIFANPQRAPVCAVRSTDYGHCRSFLRKRRRSRERYADRLVVETRY